MPPSLSSTKRSEGPARQALACLVFLFATAHVQAAEVLRVLAWPGYADEDVVRAFEKRHNARVEVTLVSTDDALREKLAGDGGGFDVFAANFALAAMMLIVMFSMAGIPVFVGFFAKFAVLKAVVGMGMVWLAMLAVACSLIGAFYYLRVVKVMYFDTPETDTPIEAALDSRILLSANCLLLLVLGLMPESLLSVLAKAVQGAMLPL